MGSVITQTVTGGLFSGVEMLRLQGKGLGRIAGGVQRENLVVAPTPTNKHLHPPRQPPKFVDPAHTTEAVNTLSITPGSSQTDGANTDKSEEGCERVEPSYSGLGRTDPWQSLG